MYKIARVSCITVERDVEMQKNWLILRLQKYSRLWAWALPSRGFGGGAKITHVGDIAWSRRLGYPYTGAQMMHRILMAPAAQFVCLAPSVQPSNWPLVVPHAVFRPAAPLKTYKNYCPMSNARHSVARNTNYLLPCAGRMWIGSANK